MPDNKKEQEREELHRAIWAIADDLRGITERVYASAAIEWEHSVDSGGSTAYLRLSGASGGKLTVARFIPIEMAAEEENTTAPTP